MNGARYRSFSCSSLVPPNRRSISFFLLIMAPTKRLISFWDRSGISDMRRADSDCRVTELSFEVECFARSRVAFTSSLVPACWFSRPFVEFTIEERSLFPTLMVRFKRCRSSWSIRCKNTRIFRFLIYHIQKKLNGRKLPIFYLF